MPQQRSELIDRTLAALLWLASFALATGIFLATTLLLRALPPTPLVAVGRVTVERASKARDYVAAALFFIMVAPLTIAFYHLGERQTGRLRRRFRGNALLSLLFIAPFLLSPFLFLTTQKWGWVIVVPLALATALPRVVIAFQTKAWLRKLFDRDMLPFHTLVGTIAASWIVFRYITTAKRIAHIPTLFLEILFIAFFVMVFWCAFVLIARIAAFTLRMPVGIAFRRLAIAGLPMVTLPVLALLLIDGRLAILIVMTAVLVAIPFALVGRSTMDPRVVRRMTALIVIPLLLYCASFVSSIAAWQSIDLFHRGESLGPASDYARGKIPYRDVFVLHGLLHDGFLDGWILELFGRDEAFVLPRPAILGSLAAPALWYLAWAVFDSVPLAALVMLLGTVPALDNDRALMEICVVAFFIAALRRPRPYALMVASGVSAAIALFYSFDVGLYSIGGALLALSVLRNFRALGAFVAGALIGIAPFAIYLASHGAFGAFLDTSFRVLPATIDATWSLPFPDLTETFRQNLNLHTISDFILFDKFRYLLNPLIVGIAITVAIRRRMRGSRTWEDVALIALICFAALTERSALGRADFPHQVFAAFLIAPILAMLLSFLIRAPRPLAIVSLIALFPILYVTLWVPDLMNARLDDVTHYAARVQQREFVDPALPEIQQRIREVRDGVTRLSKPGEPMFDFSNQPALYFFCDRPNPTRFYQVPIMSPWEFQREVIVALELARPPVVIRRSPQGFDQFDGIDNTVRAQAVAAYLDDHYEYADTRYGVELWKRKRTAVPLLTDLYLRRISVPTVKELGTIGNRSRIVFPWMTSQGGGSGTYWRSDLTLHNPTTAPMALEMRYVAGDRRVDRRVTLAPQRSIRWDDVVDTFFHVPGSGGILWIEYRGDRPPVARAQTFDAAHERGGSIAEPLSLSDSAGTGSPTNQLSLVGFSERHSLINLGVVNVGQSPMAVRITVAAADGHQVGRSVEASVAEEQAYVMTDAEAGLGVRLDPSMTANVAVLYGRAVAFGTTIESTGDTGFLTGVPSSRQ